MDLNNILITLIVGLLTPTLVLTSVSWVSLILGFPTMVDHNKRLRAQNRLLVISILLVCAIFGQFGVLGTSLLLSTTALLCYCILFLTPVGGMQIFTPKNGDLLSKVIYLVMFLPLGAAFLSSMLLARS